MKAMEVIWKAWNRGICLQVLVAMTEPLRRQLDYARARKHLYVNRLSDGELPSYKANELNGPFLVQTTYKFNKEFANANEMIEAGKKAVEVLSNDLYKISEEKAKNHDTNVLYIKTEVNLSYSPITEELIAYEEYYTGKNNEKALGV